MSPSDDLGPPATAAGVAVAEPPPTGSAAEIADLARDLGGAFYLLDLDRIRACHDDLRRAFAGLPGTLLAYSVKTHYTPRVLALARELGMLAEVVSEMEYEIVARLGFPPEEIVVNGPVHGADFLARALLAGGRVHLDGEAMLEILGEVSRAHPERQFRVGLRLTYPLPDTEWSRFGFEASPANLGALAAWFERHPNCAVAGLHSHFPLARATPETFAARLSGLVDAARTWFSARPLDYLDLGGGLRREPSGPPLAAVARAVEEVLARGYAGERRPALILEPGTALVRDAMAFVCRVYDVKRTAGRILALVEGSVHNFNTMMWQARPEVAVVRTGAAAGGESADERSAGEFDVAGHTCMERKDLIRTGVPGPVARGDFLVFPDVGAYSCALKPPFIHPCPPVVARQGGRYEIVKRRETVDDILATYTL